MTQARACKIEIKVKVNQGKSLFREFLNLGAIILQTLGESEIWKNIVYQIVHKVVDGLNEIGNIW